MNKFQKFCVLFKQEGLSGTFFSGVFAGIRRILKRNLPKLRRRISGIADPADFAAHNVCCRNARIANGDKVLYLTFDVEWKKPENVGLILDALKERNVSATFFLLGEGMEQNADWVRRIRAEGHSVGNHTMTHPALNRCTCRRIRRELSQCAGAYRSIAGEELPKIMRPPYGKLSRRAMKCLHRMGYQTFLWNMHVYDWKKNAPTTWDVFRSYLETDLKNGGIILQHTYSDETAAHMGKYMDHCLSGGYRFGLLQEIGENKSEDDL